MKGPKFGHASLCSTLSALQALMWRSFRKPDSDQASGHLRFKLLVSSLMRRKENQVQTPIYNTMIR